MEMVSNSGLETLSESIFKQRELIERLAPCVSSKKIVVTIQIFRKIFV
jgi:hypothetical protein